ncbi:hypothetical protein ACFXKD_19155 [Nocardiopsis aegyptia]|uniref:hypothetical protein n=1 Tax=Nocardiopsis aegyptia TaxID=220378 RepID=UPI003670BADD
MILLKVLAAIVAVVAWVIAALWMLMPVAQNNTAPEDSNLPPGYVWCELPVEEVWEPRTSPGCLERREQAPARALTAMVIALPASWVWFGLRVKPSSPETKSPDLS